MSVFCHQTSNIVPLSSSTGPRASRYPPQSCQPPLLQSSSSIPNQHSSDVHLTSPSRRVRASSSTAAQSARVEDAPDVDHDIEMAHPFASPNDAPQHASENNTSTSVDASDDTLRLDGLKEEEWRGWCSLVYEHPVGRDTHGPPKPHRTLAEIQAEEAPRLEAYVAILDELKSRRINDTKEQMEVIDSLKLMSDRDFCLVLIEWRHRRTNRAPLHPLVIENLDSMLGFYGTMRACATQREIWIPNLDPLLSADAAHEELEDTGRVCIRAE